MSSSPSKTPSQESSSSDSDESLYEIADDKQISSNTQTPDQISSHPENILKNQEQQTILDQPTDSLIQPNQPIISQCAQSLGNEVSTSDEQTSNVVVRPQKPSAFVLKNLMSRPPGTLRIPAPHLRKIQSQEEGTGTGELRNQPGTSRNVESPQEELISAVSKKVKPAVSQKEFKRKFDSKEEIQPKRKKLKPLEFDQQGEESRFLFPLSESEREDDFVTLKFLSTYVSNGGNLAPEFARVVVNFINDGIVAENCRIEVSQFRRKVMALHKKFLRLVEQNGGENFRKADFSTDRDYEMAVLCNIVWTDRQESKRSGSCVDLNSDPTSDEMKSADDIVREVEGMSLGYAGGIVDPGNAAGLVVNVDHGNGADPGMNVDQGTEARADPGVTMDETNGADEKKDCEMVIDRTAVGLCNTDTIQEPNARDDTDPPIKIKVYTTRKIIAKK